MIGSTFAQHVPLVYGFEPAPPAPPAPPQPPQPPQAEPIAFSVVTRPSLFGIVGDAISSTTLATVTCADASMTIVQSETVPGLTFTYAANVLTVAGTPTGPTRVHRVVFSYMSSDGDYTVRGSTSHGITIVDATEVLTIGDMAGAGGRVGIPLSVTLANLSANYLVNVTAHPGALIPGLTASLAWTPDATSTGVLTLAGTPTFAGTYSLTVNFRAGAIDLGTSTHEVVIAPAYEVAPPAPAPAPAPSPPAPSPPPAPTPAPAPGLGPDPFIDSVKVLMHFDTATGLATDVKGNLILNYGGVVSTTGAVREGALFTWEFDPEASDNPRTFMRGIVPGASGADGLLAAECMVDIDADCWADLTAAAGSLPRFVTVMSIVTGKPSAPFSWALGFISYPGTVAQPARRVYAAAAIGVANSVPAIVLGPSVTGLPDRYVHLALGRKQSATAGQYQQSVWFGGESGPISSGSIASLVSGTTETLNVGYQTIGSSIHAGANVYSGVIFEGRIDELRATAAGRYTDYIGTTLPPAARVIPWPNN